MEMKKMLKKSIAVALTASSAVFGVWAVNAIRPCDPVTGVYDGDYIPGSNDDTLYAIVNAGTSPAVIDADLYLYVTKNGFTTGAIEYALNNGYMLGYIDLLKQGGWIPQDFIPAGSSSSAPAADTAQSSTVENNPQQTTQSTTAETNQKTEPTKDESVSGTYIVINDDTSVYDNYSAGTELEVYGIGTSVEVTGLYSNGMYEFKYNDGSAYIRQKNLAVAEDYEAAWELTETVDASCTEAGKNTYTNSLSGAQKEEEIPASGHTYEVTETVDATCTEAGKTVYTCAVCGDSYEEEIKATGHEAGKWEVTKEAKAFSKGERVKKCTVCGEVLETESISQTFPLPLWSVIAIGVVVAAIIAVIVTVFIRKKKNNVTIEETEK